MLPDNNQEDIQDTLPPSPGLPETDTTDTQEAPSDTGITPDQQALKQALIEQESGGNPSATNPKSSAKGLGQFIDSTGRNVFAEAKAARTPGATGDYDPYDPVKANAMLDHYLPQLEKKYGNKELALAAYHDGEPKVDDLLKQSSDGTFDSIKSGLTNEGQAYVPSVMGKYKAKKGSTDTQDTTQATDTVPEVKYTPPDVSKFPSTDRGFADALMPIIADPSFESLSFGDKAQRISGVFNAKNWGKDAFPVFKQVMTNMWDGASPDEVPDLNQIIGAPPITPSTQDPKKATEAWKVSKVQELVHQGVSPGVFGDRLDAYMDNAAQSEIDAYTARNRSYAGSAVNWIGNSLREMGKGVGLGVLKPIAGLARLTTFSKTADTLEALPEVLGKPAQDYLYVTDSNGYLKLDSEGQPIPRWSPMIAEGIGQIGTFIAGGAYLKAAGWGAMAIEGQLIEANSLALADDIFKSVKEKTGSTGKAYAASLFAIPAATIGSLGQLSVVTKFMSPELKSLSNFDMARMLAKTFTKNAALNAVTGAGMDATTQAGEMSQTDQPFSAERMTKSAIVGAAAGGIASTAMTGVEVSPPVMNKKMSAAAVANMTMFKASLLSEANSDIPAARFPQNIASDLGIRVEPTENGKTRLSRVTDIVPPEIVTPEDFAKTMEEIKSRPTPTDMHELGVERAKILEDSKVSVDEADKNLQEGPTSEVRPPTEEELSQDTAKTAKKAPVESKLVYSSKGEETPLEEPTVESKKTTEEKVSSPEEPALKDLREKRLSEIDDTLSKTDSNTYENDIKVLESSIAKHLDENPDALPGIKYNKDTLLWENKDTGESALNLKDLIAPEPVTQENPDVLRASKLPTSGRFTVYAPKVDLRKNPDYVVPYKYDYSGQRKVSVTEPKAAILRAQEAVSKETGNPKTYAKIGGKIEKGVAGYTRPDIKNKSGKRGFKNATNIIRIGNSNDLMTMLHEYVHKMDFDMPDAYANATKPVQQALEDSASLYYPKSKLTPQELEREGFTMFLQSYAAGQPVSKVLLDWWHGTISKQFPKTYAGFENAVKSIREYYNQTTDNYMTQFREGQKPTRLGTWLKAVRDPYVWMRDMIDKDYIAKQIGEYSNSNFGDLVESQAHKVAPHIRDIMEGHYSEISDFNGNRIKGVKPLNQILAGVKAQGRLDEYVNYITARKIAAMHSQLKASGMSQKDTADIIRRVVFEQAPESFRKTVENLSPLQMDKALEAGHIPKSDLDITANEMYRWWGAVLDMAAERSPIIRRQVESIRAHNQELFGNDHGWYVPASREFETLSPSEGQTEGMGLTNPFKRQVGSTRRFTNPLLAFEDVARNIFNAAQTWYITDHLVSMSKAGLPIGKFIEQVPRGMTAAYKAQLGTIAEKLGQQMRGFLTDELGIPKGTKGLTPNVEESGIITKAKLLEAGEFMKTALASTAPGDESPQHVDSQDFLDKVATFWVPQMKPSKSAEGYVTIPYPLGNGKMEFYEVHPDVLGLFNNELPSIISNPFLMPLTTIPKRVLQVSATTFSLPFQVANLLFRDFQTALLSQKNSNVFSPITLTGELLRSLYDQAITGTGFSDKTWTALADRMGVITSTRYGSEENLRQAMRGSGLYKYLGAPLKLIDLAENVLSYGERANRLSIMREAGNRMGITDPNQTLTPEQTIELINAYQRSTVNFAVQGRVARVANTWIPFFTARIAELSALKGMAKANPAKAAVLSLGYLALGVANVMAYKDEKWFKNVDPTYRSGYWMSTIPDKNGRDQVIAMPLSISAAVPYTFGHMLASQLLEEGLIKPTALSYLMAAAKNAAPLQGQFDPKSGFGLADIMPVPMKLAIEHMMNLKFFSHKAIVPQGLQMAPPSQQVTANTSEMAKSIAAAIGTTFGEDSGLASPLRVDDIMRSIVPGPAKAEAYLERSFGVKPINDKASVPLIWSAIARGSASSITDNSNNMFYDQLNKFRSISAVATPQEEKIISKMNKISGLISDISKDLSVAPDAGVRDDLYTKRQDLFMLGISIAKGSNDTVPSYGQIKAEAKKIRTGEKKARSEAIKQSMEQQ